MPPRTSPSPRRAVRFTISIAILILVPRLAGAWAPNGIPVAPLGSNQMEPAVVADAGGVYVGWIGSGTAVHLQRLDQDGLVSFGWPDTGLNVLPMQGNLILLADGAGGVFAAADPQSTSGAASATRITPSGAIASRWPLTLPNAAVPLTGDDPDASSVAPEDAQLVYTTYLPVMTRDDRGGVLIAWMHSIATVGFETSDHLHLAHLKSNGEPETGWPRYGIRTGYDGAMIPKHIQPVICADDSGGAYVAYVNRATDPHFVYLHRVTDDQSRNLDARVCATGGDQDAVGMVPDGESGAILVWEDRRNGSFAQVYAQRVLPDMSVAPGWPVDGLRLCSQPTAPGDRRLFLGEEIDQSSVASDGSGGAFVVWRDFRAGAWTADLYAQHVRGDGTLEAGWPADGLPICRAAGDQLWPSVAADGAGGLYVAWEDERAQSGDTNIFVQHVDGSGVLRFEADGLALCDAAGAQERPIVAADGVGGAYVAWIDARGGAPLAYAAKVPDARVAVLASLVQVEAGADRVRLTWFVSGPDVWSVLIERRDATTDWTAIGRRVPAVSGRVRFEDRDVRTGSRYAYRLTNTAGVPISSETWIEIPSAATLALDGARPNPSAGSIVASFALPDATPATLELWDAAGRRLATRDVGAFGAGRHLLEIGGARPAPGIYFLRLARGAESTVRRVCVAR